MGAYLFSYGTVSGEQLLKENETLESHITELTANLNDEKQKAEQLAIVIKEHKVITAGLQDRLCKKQEVGEVFATLCWTDVSNNHL